ncbi:hypothetical protein D6F12_00515 [Salmonella enterica]|uniref:glycosyltransferase family 39 protein n=1 Tax=Salmonella enterica TaxID=28901 RepID=UPI000B53D80D|nr:glycosyltransferase family 39 protein [Salmonella enterica]ECU8746165.1 hypothetical protein [Salmonella enterica subsp. diarizonae str. CFSAN000558]HAE8383790.1 hypothetical protein [Salmonella enterica subsp. diarizonae serovar 50:k:z]HAU2966074.1 hypothetical protein [Salmonella enterica subsp. diarizonae]ASG75922.1 hypothetical protein LFZ53_12440 [Salmonella enterica subsp. diarizonae serovar 50:k:z str. MZ0080]EAS3777063.1 hypothetical protein [Salmonella enterica]
MALPQLSIWQPGNGLRKIKYKYHVRLIVMFSVIIRLLFLTDRYLWCDEASSVLISRHNVDSLLFHAAFDVHPPLYYLLLHDWMILLGDSITAVRSLSLLFGILTVALVIALTRWLANERTALLAGWFVALMPMAVHYSQETRMYALLGMLTLAAALALMMWVKTPVNNRYLVAYALLMTFSFYTHYFTIFVLIAHWIAVTILSFQSHKTTCYLKLPGWWFANLAIAVVYLPWLPVLFNLLTHMAQLRSGNDIGWIAPITWRDLPAMYWHFFTGNNGQDFPAIILWLAAGSFIGTVGRISLCNGENERYRLILFCNLVIPVTLVFLISWWMPLFIDRYFFFSSLSIPPLLAALLTRVKKAFCGFCFLVFTLLFGYGLYHNNPTRKDEFKPLVNYINTRYQPNDAVIVSKMFDYLSYVYYNRRDYRTFLYTPPNADGTSGRPNAYGFGSLFYAQADQTYIDNLTTLSKRHHRVWLISGGNFCRDYPLPPEWKNIASFRSGRFQVQLFVIPGQQAR